MSVCGVVQRNTSSSRGIEKAWVESMESCKCDWLQLVRSATESRHDNVRYNGIKGDARNERKVTAS